MRTSLHSRVIVFCRSKLLRADHSSTWLGEHSREIGDGFEEDAVAALRTVLISSSPILHTWPLSLPELSASTTKSVQRPQKGPGKKLATGQIFSQPALSGSGQHANTVLVTALEALKAQKSPVRLEDFALTHGLMALMEDETLRERLKNHPRVEWNAKLDLWSYKVSSRAACSSDRHHTAFDPRLTSASAP